MKWDALTQCDWLGDVIWHHGPTAGSKLVQLMACCLTAPSHYLNPCWLIINRVLYHLTKGRTENAHESNHYKEFEIFMFNIKATSPWHNELMLMWRHTNAPMIEHRSSPLSVHAPCSHASRVPRDTHPRCGALHTTRRCARRIRLRPHLSPNGIGSNAPLMNPKFTDLSLNLTVSIMTVSWWNLKEFGENKDSDYFLSSDST